MGFIVGLLKFWTGFVLFVSFVIIAIISIDIESPEVSRNKFCSDPPTRFSYVMPARLIACWFTETLDNK